MNKLNISFLFSLMICMIILMTSCENGTSIEYTILAYPRPEEAGTIQKLTNQNSFKPGETARFKAIPSDNYRFLNWTENNIVIGDDSILKYVTSERNAVLYGNFEPFEQTGDTIENVMIPEGWDYLDWAVDFSQTYIHSEGQPGTQAYIRRVDNNEKLFIIQNDPQSLGGTYALNHIVQLDNLPMVEINDNGMLVLRTATNTSQNPIPDENRWSAGITTAFHHGSQQELLRVFAPPVRIEIRWRTDWVPGNFIALWMYHSNWTPHQGFSIGKEFDLIEAGGHEVLGQNGQFRSAVHSWQRYSNQQKSGQVQKRPYLTLTNPTGWRTSVFEWHTGPNDSDKLILYYISDKDEPTQITSVTDFDTPYLRNTHHRLTESLTWQDIIREDWENPMKLSIWHNLQFSSRYVGYDNPDPRDFPVDMEVDWVRVFKRH